MSSSPLKSSFKSELETAFQSEYGIIPPSSLRSKRTYTCAKHPHKDAFCLCAKCGKLLCEKCEMTVSGRRYCETCLIEDDGLRVSFEEQFFKSRQKTAEEEEQIEWKAPKTIREIPVAILNMMSDSQRFFKTAKDSSFVATFIMAYIALLPQGVYLYLEQLKDLIPQQPEKLQPYLEQISNFSDISLIGIACAVTLIRLLFLDFIYFICTRIFTQGKLSFKQTASVLHFCLCPLLLCVLGQIAHADIITIIPACLMVIYATTATRVATQCNTLQGMGAMLSFLFISMDFLIIM